MDPLSPGRLAVIKSRLSNAISAFEGEKTNIFWGVGEETLLLRDRGGGRREKTFL